METLQKQMEKITTNKVTEEIARKVTNILPPFCYFYLISACPVINFVLGSLRDLHRIQLSPVGPDGIPGPVFSSILGKYHNTKSLSNTSLTMLKMLVYWDGRRIFIS